MRSYGPTCSATPPPATVAIADAALATAPFRAGQRVTLSVALEASAARVDYGVEFMLFPVAPEGAQVEGVSFGSTMFPVVGAGASTMMIETELPLDLAPGDYLLAVHEYPDGELVDSTQGNLSIAAAVRHPVLDITSYAQDEGLAAFLVDAAGVIASPDVHLDNPFSGTIEIASWTWAATRVPVRASLEWSGGSVPLSLWDSSLGRYVDTLFVTLDADKPASFGLELAMTEAEAAALRPSVPPQAAIPGTVVITVNQDRSVEEGPCGDPDLGPSTCVHSVRVPSMISIPAAEPAQGGTVPQSALFTPRTSREAGLSIAPFGMSALGDPVKYQSSKVSYGKSYAKSLGDPKKFSATLTFSGSASLWQDGFASSAQAGLPLSIFGHAVNFLGATATAKAPVDLPAYANYQFNVAGITVVAAEKSLPEIRLALPKLSVAKELGYSTTIMVGPVPVALAVGARGEMGVDWYFTLSAAIGAKKSASLQMSVDPFARLAGYGSAGVGFSFKGYGFSAGLELKLTVMNLTLDTGATGSLEILDVGYGPYLWASLSEDMSLTLADMLKGGFGLYASYPAIKFCKAWGVKFPCGFKQKHNSKSLFTSSGFKYGPLSILHMGQNGLGIKMPCTVQTSCQAAGATCGTIPDGCGGALACPTCGSGSTCTENHCVLSCGQGLTACPGANPTYCANLAVDASNCGACGVVCTHGTWCANGACQASCTPRTCADSMAAGQCAINQDDGCGGNLTCGCLDAMVRPVHWPVHRRLRGVRRWILLVHRLQRCGLQRLRPPVWRGAGMLQLRKLRRLRSE